MTREEFIQVLEKYGYPYEIEGDKIVVTHKGRVNLKSLTSLPPDVEFNNVGFVNFYSLTSLPPGVVFNNTGGVDLQSLTSLPPEVVFNNGDDIHLESIVSKITRNY